jgi:DNA-binding transcriptional ArsR family regulator
MDPLSTTFFALADPTRRAIVARLAMGETHVGELGKPFRVTAPAISRHLRVLEKAGMIERKVVAQRRVCSLRGEGLVAAHHWVEQYRQFWEAGLDRLVAFLEAPPAPPIGGRRPATGKRAARATPAKRKGGPA